MASTAAAGGATASISGPEVPTPVPDVPSPSAQPAAEEELEEVFCRRLLQGPPEEEAAPLPHVLARVRQTIEDATSTAKVAFRRDLGLEVRKLELDKLSESLHQWHQELQAAASKQAVAEMELEEDRKSLAKRESHATNMELQLAHQREALKSMKESAAKKEAKLQERTREVEAAQAALDTRVQEAIQEAVQKLQEDQLRGA
ncbi:uncharacterized protein At3g61260-like [Panicum virgatum]|uniref:uncharacterized protein At3g61260-like n=1 Tax=Panicum virgatum TaxID=38727 RepID=UPI0019D634FE|nr:uncharacterized protein At3g61260-like [Panicum virgatum]